LLRTRYSADPVWRRIPSLFTIHNLAYQGVFPAETLSALDLGSELLSIDGLEFWNQVSFLKGGINFADTLTTVSPAYAREIRTPEYGEGLEGLLVHRQHVLTGILNGIDTDTWNPWTDPYLPAPFSAADLGGKRFAKRAVLTRYGLPDDATAMARPLIGMVSRLVGQKGLDLVWEGRGALAAMDAAFVVLGSGERRYEEMWRDLAAAHPTRIGVRVGFDEGLAHLIEGGADLFLMPSRFEPCGLNQMYSMRYGTVPVVRATGGLDDTVRPFDPDTGAGTGFTFHEYRSSAMLVALEAALALYARPARWRALQQAGMRQDFSWDASAAAYVHEYRKVIDRRREADGERGE
ncbi:MAG TPA: glycosyltransferase, partial [Acidobacteria bacterium]|nr:glycosyltransferase [Acidobacteriota bacterium]